MLEAFREEGFRVDCVVGTSKQRRKQMDEVRSRIRSGTDYRFMYAESATLPIQLTDPHHLPVRPFQDALFFAEISRNEIPTGLFYRDVYWQIDALKYRGPWWKRIPKQVFLWIEWYMFRAFVDRLFLPSMHMYPHIPTSWPKDRVSALPPGCRQNAAGSPKEPSRASSGGSRNSLRLFYVGGVEPPYYDLRPLFDMVKQVEGVSLTLCCREEEWAEQKDTYGVDGREDIEVVHAHSDTIGKYYRRADVAADLRRPEGYLELTLPIKTVEAVGYGVPSLVLQGTPAASFVDAEQVGWTVASLEEAEDMLRHLRDHPDEIIEKRQHVVSVQQDHTWQARVRQAASVLAGETNTG
jgi:hypothetical protein